MSGYLGELLYPIPAISPTAGVAGQTTLTGAACDTEAVACDGVLVVVHMGGITTAGVQSLKVQQSDDDGNEDDYSDLEGSEQTIADNADGKVFMVDVKRPAKRYLKVIVERATQDSACSAMYYLYGLRNLPATHASANVGGYEKYVAPDEGTA